MISNLFEAQDGAEASFATTFVAVALTWFGTIVLATWGGWAVVSFINMEFVIPASFVGWKIYRIFAVMSAALALYTVLHKGDNGLRYVWDAKENEHSNRSMDIANDTKKTLAAMKKTREAITAMNDTIKRQGTSHETE